jgi:tetratricopeptide (TPR) repeat protein
MSQRSLMGWVAFFIIVGFAVQQLPSLPGLFYFFKGQHQSNAHQFQAAAESYQKAVDSDPEFLRGYVELGSSYLQLKKYAEAESALKKAMSIQEDSCAACGLGMVYLSSHRYQEADLAFKKAISLDANDVCAYEQSGKLYYDQGKYQESIEALTQAARLKPRDTTYHFLGNAYMYSKRFDEAINTYWELLRINPNYDEVYFDLAAAYYRVHRYQESAAAYNRAIKRNEQDSRAHLGLGLTQVALGDRTKALEEYRVLQHLEPKWAAFLLAEINKQSSQQPNPNF